MSCPALYSRSRLHYTCHQVPMGGGGAGGGRVTEATRSTPTAIVGGCFLVFGGHCRAEVPVLGIPGSAARPHQYANS